MRSTLFLIAICVSSVAGFATRMPSPKMPSDAFVREAEKKHARIALLALPTLGAIYAATGDNPATYLSHQSADVQSAFFGVSSLFEAASLSRLAPNFALKDGVTPGNWGVKSVSADTEKLEDAAGRIAMLATTATILYFLGQPG